MSFASSVPTTVADRLRPVESSSRHAARALDDVVVRHDVASGIEDEAGTRGRPGPHLHDARHDRGRGRRGVTTTGDCCRTACRPAARDGVGVRLRPERRARTCQPTAQCSGAARSSEGIRVQTPAPHCRGDVGVAGGRRGRPDGHRWPGGHRRPAGPRGRGSGTHRRGEVGARPPTQVAVRSHRRFVTRPKGLGGAGNEVIGSSFRAGGFGECRVRGSG